MAIRCPSVLSVPSCFRVTPSVFIRLGVVAYHICEITRHSEKIRTYSSSGSSKVIDLKCQSTAHLTSDVFRTVFEILANKAKTTHPVLFAAPAWGGTRQNFWMKVITVTVNVLVKLSAFNAHICPSKYLVSS